MMKKVMVKLPIEYVYHQGFSEAMQYIKKLSVIEILNLYPDSMTVLERLIFKDPDFKPDNLIGIDGINYVEVLKYNQKNNEYSCILQLENANVFSPYLREYKIMVSHPILIIKDELYIPYISYGKNIKKVYEKISNFVGDNYDIVKITEYSLNEDNLYTNLTGRQLEIATVASSMGYFDTPKRISTQKLAEIFEISPSALTEHMRNIREIVFKRLF